MTSEAKKASLPASPLSDEPRQKRETPRLQPLATNRHRASQPVETAMTSELRPAVAVWIDAEEAYARSHKPDPKGGRYTFADPFAPAAVIQAYGDEREAKGRAGQAAELAKFKALAETLAGALEPVERLEMWSDNAENSAMVILTVGTVRKMREALRQYKEARDA